MSDYEYGKCSSCEYEKKPKDELPCRVCTYSCCKWTRKSTDKLERAIGYLNDIGWMQEHDKALTENAEQVVRCKDCRWYEPPHILHDDGTKTYVDDGSPFVPASVGINVGGKCMNTLREYCCNHDREDPDDYERLVKFRDRMDYCSDGERKDNEL